MRQPKIRHSLSALLTLAISRGLRASNEAVEPLLHMDRSHSDHSFRYTQDLAPDKVTIIFHAKPEAAIAGIGMLLDHATLDPAKLRSHAGSAFDWPLAMPVDYPITSEQLARWIDEIADYQNSMREAADSRQT